MAARLAARCLAYPSFHFESARGDRILLPNWNCDLAISSLEFSPVHTMGFRQRIAEDCYDIPASVAVKTREIVYLLFKQPWAPLLPILQGLNGREMA